MGHDQSYVGNRLVIESKYLLFQSLRFVRDNSRLNYNTTRTGDKSLLNHMATQFR